MPLRIRHIFLLLGILLTIFSFLFFGRQQETYSTLLLTGLFFSGVFFIWILFKDSKRQKWLWTAVVGASILTEQLSEAFLINCSYKIFLGHNLELLTKVNQIMQSKSGDVFYFKNSEPNRSKFNAAEESTINELFKQTNIYMILKDSTKIYYGTYGMLDVRLGISYVYSERRPDKRLRQIEDRWYY
jgi:hypothetical protein